MQIDGRKRVVIENVRPALDGFPVKRIVGERVVVSADILCDSHDVLSAMVLFRPQNEQQWSSAHMELVDNDQWKGSFLVSEIGIYFYTVQAWVDHFGTWQHNLSKKYHAEQDISVELQIGAQYLFKAADRMPLHFSSLVKERATQLLEQDRVKSFFLATDKEITALVRAYPDVSLSTIYKPELQIIADSQKALFSSWYELFPRSCGSQGKHGSFQDCIERLPYVASMGFDILYLAPIYPIGLKNRKGKNNSVTAEQNAPGSPWAIGSPYGGHTAIEPSLGSMEDFVSLVNAAASFGIEIALDLAFQCAPDHPWVEQFPQWFKTRPDGTIQYAENPPKRYEDIVPFDFETTEWKELWDELKNVVLFWIDKGIRIFRVDNPHTKPFLFWEWLIGSLRTDYPDLIFLSEAFTRPKIVNLLSKAGFNQSYTYFTWRNTKSEITEYFQELTGGITPEFFRPNLWPNTPDILPEYLQFGGKNAFAVRLILAATLSPSYGIYGPAFENAINEAMEGKEEYLNSEKYEIKSWDWQNPPLKELIAKVNSIRKENPALQILRNLHFYPVDNEYLLVYAKTTPDLSNVILVVVNIDPLHKQSGFLQLPLEELKIDPAQTYMVYDLLGEERFMWSGPTNFIILDPQKAPAHIFTVHRNIQRESDYDYF